MLDAPIIQQRTNTREYCRPLDKSILTMELVSNSQSVSQHPQKGDGGPETLEVTDAQSVEAGHLTETKFSRLSVWVTLSFMSIAVASDS
jgi:hypothetical protein